MLRRWRSDLRRSGDRSVGMAIRVKAGTAVAAAATLTGLVGAQWWLTDPLMRTVAEPPPEPPELPPARAVPFMRRFPI